MDVEDKLIVNEINDLIDRENKEVKNKMKDAFEVVKMVLEEAKENAIPTMTTDEYILLESIETMYGFYISNKIGTDTSMT
jgi:ribonucleotide reductase beta subunit family protein with ferritin-like domain